MTELAYIMIGFWIGGATATFTITVKTNKREPAWWLAFAALMDLAWWPWMLNGYKPTELEERR